MNDNKTKIKLIFVPYLIISLATFIGWTFLHWLFFIKLNVQVSESAITIIVPAVLPLISVLIWLNKRLKLLNIKNGNVAFYLIIPCIAMGGLIYFARQYIILTTSKLTNLSSINQIDKEEPAKFYTLKNFYLDKKQFGTSGKSAQNLEMYIYITVPILNSVKDTLGSTCIGWYGITYNETAHDFLNDYDINELREIDLNQNVYDYDENADKINQLVKRS